MAIPAIVGMARYGQIWHKALMDTKKLKQRISRYKSALKKEKQKFGFYDDGGGKRFMLFYLYLATDDVEGGLAYIDWYQQEFPDCAGEPYQLLSWTLLLARAGKVDDARKQLARLIDNNLYLVPQLLDRECPDYSIKSWGNWEEPVYFREMPDELDESITDTDKEWLAQQYDSEAMQTFIAEYVRLTKLLDKESDSEKRGRILNFRRNLIENI